MRPGDPSISLKLLIISFQPWRIIYYLYLHCATTAPKLSSFFLRLAREAVAPGSTGFPETGLGSCARFCRMGAMPEEARHAPELLRWVEAFPREIEVVREAILDKHPPPVAKRLLVGVLTYRVRQMDLIPDRNEEFGRADDSAVVRAVLMEHERVLADFAQRHRLNWAKITVHA